ncbi:hypothetical protein ACFFHK_00965 [Gallibacterium trehalosifermentans]|uniref:Beta-1,4-N-acetylgalactosaminyltransferase n=1 Tax=Gallibacterium trehalosifermentans TaxID=516935 RepID=A0ABV6GZP6_9PAST
MKLFSYINKLKKKLFYSPEFRSLFNVSQEAESVNPFAFIRVHNEIRTVKASLSSIEGIITRGVIGYHDCTDGTEEYILQFCERNKGFIPYKYPHSIWPADDSRYFDAQQPKNSCYYLDTYYNAVLDKIPDNEWLIKIDCDQVYDRELLQATLKMPKNIKECIFIPRINLHYYDKKFYVLRNMPLSIERDHWLIYKTPKLRFEMSIGIDSQGRKYAYELLQGLSDLYWIDTEVMHWHFPLMKSRREVLQNNDENFVLLDEAKENLLVPYKKLLPANIINTQYITQSLQSYGFQSWKKS